MKLYQKKCDNCGQAMRNEYPANINYCCNCGHSLKNSALFEVTLDKIVGSNQASAIKPKQEGPKQDEKKKDDLGNTIDQIKNLKEYEGEE